MQMFCNSYDLLFYPPVPYINMFINMYLETVQFSRDISLDLAVRLYSRIYGQGVLSIKAWACVPSYIIVN